MSRRRCAVAVAIVVGTAVLPATQAVATTRKAAVTVALSSGSGLTTCRAAALSTHGTRLTARGDRLIGWSFDAGDRSLHTHGTALPSSIGHTWRAAGRYTASLAVRDRWGSVTRKVTVTVKACPSPAPLVVPAPTPAPVATVAPTVAPSVAPTTPPPPPDPVVTALAALTRAGATVGDATSTIPSATENAAVVVRMTAPVPGWVLWQRGSAPTGALVVYAHGYSGIDPNTGGLWNEPAAAASELQVTPAFAATILPSVPAGTVVFAPDYRTQLDYRPDLAALDAYTGAAAVRSALGLTGQVVAYGNSEGGAVTGLLAEAHPSFVTTWVSASGATDVLQVRTELIAGTTRQGDQLMASALLGAVDGGLGITENPAPNPAPSCSQQNVLALSPSCSPDLLAGLGKAYVVHSTGDQVVPYAVATSLVSALHARSVPVTLVKIDDRHCSPSMSMNWHDDYTDRAAAIEAVRAALTGSTVPTSVQRC